MPSYTKLKPKTYTVMLNKECDSYDYMQRILLALSRDIPLSYYQLKYRIKTSRIGKAIETLEDAQCIILLCRKYRLTDKGRKLLPLLNKMIDRWET